MTGRTRDGTVTLVGAGNLAHALVRLLPAADYKVVEIVTRSGSVRARKLGRNAGAPATTITRARWSGDIVWLAVSDSAIPELAAELGPVTNWRGKVVLHSSGALTSEQLAPLRRRGARVASVHPMMTFVPGETPDLTGVVWTLEGDSAAIGVARQIVKRLGGRALTIDPKHKPVYHAFGAFLSPLLVVHLVTACQLALRAGIPRRELAPVMKPIVEQTMCNLLANIGRNGGAGKAFSGPLIRGDVATVRAHLQSLRTIPVARNLYVALVEAAIAGNLPVKNRGAISKLIRKMA